MNERIKDGEETEVLLDLFRPPKDISAVYSTNAHVEVVCGVVELVIQERWDTVLCRHSKNNWQTNPLQHFPVFFADSCGHGALVGGNLLLCLDRHFLRSSCSW